MQDNLDQALQNLPSEPYPAALTERIIDQFRRQRRRQRLILRAGWASAGSAAAVGAILFSGRIAEHSQTLPVFSVGAIVRWTNEFSASPHQTMIGSMMSFWDWVQMSLVGLGWVSVVALALLMVSAFWTLGNLLIDTDMDEILWA